jgi:prolipoprotein diacylglyceryltransferase
MFPTLFKIPGVDWPINSYGFAIMVGFLLCSYIAVQRAKPLGIKSDFILDLGIISMIAGILGAKVNYLLQYSDEVTDGSKMSIWGDMGLDPLGALILGPIPFAFWFWRMKRSGEKIRLYQWQTGVLMVLTLFFALLGTRALFLFHNSELYSWKVFRNWQSGSSLRRPDHRHLGGILYIKMLGSRSRDGRGPARRRSCGAVLRRIGCFLQRLPPRREGGGFPAPEFPPTAPPRDQPGLAGMVNPVHPTQL